jgi:hypothetical protein
MHMKKIKNIQTDENWYRSWLKYKMVIGARVIIFLFVLETMFRLFYSDTEKQLSGMNQTCLQTEMQIPQMTARSSLVLQESNPLKVCYLF